ncbi:MAG TPA: nucleoside hydrolase [Opitutaceae bacterium]|nr:nucleoside hydrolase [Opitutaceae bacterium]
MIPKPSRFCRAAFLVVFVSLVAVLRGEAVKIIYDTDMASDVDDVGALAILHALADRGEAEILACMISSDNESVGPCIEAINTWYGRPDIPIGKVEDLKLAYPVYKGGEEVPSAYTHAIAKAFPHKLQRTSDAPRALELYRKILSAQPDRSVVIVSVGFLTNLKNLLNSMPDEFSPLKGEDLVRAKVAQLVCMGGKFPDGRFANGGGEYNVAWDTEASVRAINDWPTPAVFSGWEIGNRVRVGSKLAEREELNPVRTAYAFFNNLQDREAWDLTAVLFAVRGAGDLWTLSEPGLCLMHAAVPHGYNEWIADGKHQQRYLIEKAPPEKVAEVLNELLTMKPRKSVAQSGG